MPYGGKYQLTETQAMVAKLPVMNGKTDTVTMMSYGFDPYLSSWSPYHGAVYAVVESVARIVANGGDYSKIRFTFQEYFRRMTEDPKRWSQPFAALLGAYTVHRWDLDFRPSAERTVCPVPSMMILIVPPTLVSFAVDVAKQTGYYHTGIEERQASKTGMDSSLPKDSYDLPDYAADHGSVWKTASRISRHGKVLSAYALDGHGIAAGSQQDGIR